MIRKKKKEKKRHTVSSSKRKKKHIFPSFLDRQRKKKIRNVDPFPKE